MSENKYGFGDRIKESIEEGTNSLKNALSGTYNKGDSIGVSNTSRREKSHKNINKEDVIENALGSSIAVYEGMKKGCFVKDKNYGELPAAIVSVDGKKILVGIDIDWVNPEELKYGDEVLLYEDKLIIRKISYNRDTYDIPDVKLFNDSSSDLFVGGMNDIKRILKPQLDIIKKYLEARKNGDKNLADLLGKNSIRSMIIYGPTGTGKTLLSMAIANYLELPYIFVDTPSLEKSYLGDTQQEIKSRFIEAINNEPVVLCFDEVTRIVASRRYGESGAEREMAAATEEFLSMLNNQKKDHYVLVIGTSNLPEYMDDAAVRRFESQLYVGYPSLKEKKEIALSLLRYNGVNENLEELATYLATKIHEINEKSTGSHIEFVRKHAFINALSEILESDRDFRLRKKNIDYGLSIYKDSLLIEKRR